MRSPATIGSSFLVLLLCQPVQAQDSRVACVNAAEQAQKLRSDHKLLQAREQLLICAQAACPDVVQTDCAQWLSQLETTMPSIVIKAYDPSDKDMVLVTVLLDGDKLVERLDGVAQPVNPGVHHIRFESEGMVAVEELVVIREGEKQRALAVRFKPLEPKRPEPNLESTPHAPAHEANATRLVPYLLGGVGLVALGSFGYFGISGITKSGNLASGCGATKSCSEAEVDPLKRDLLLADISLGVGLVSLGVATWMFLSRAPTTPKHGTTVQVRAGPSGGSVQLGWRL